MKKVLLSLILSANLFATSEILVNNPEPVDTIFSQQNGKVDQNWMKEMEMISKYNKIVNCEKDCFLNEKISKDKFEKILEDKFTIGMLKSDELYKLKTENLIEIPKNILDKKVSDLYFIPKNKELNIEIKKLTLLKELEKFKRIKVVIFDDWDLKDWFVSDPLIMKHNMHILANMVNTDDLEENVTIKQKFQSGTLFFLTVDK